MRVLVTGGNGKIGCQAVEAFREAGHEVLSLDRDAPRDPVPDVDHRICDVTDMGDVSAAVLGFGPRVVVHLAAWINAGIVADHRTFADNAAGAFNVTDAAAGAGVARVILGSSAQVYGFEAHDPVRVPVDEDHPLRPVNAYALSKIANEATGAYVSANTATDVLSFRIMGARPAERMAAEIAELCSDSAKGRFLLWTRVDVRDVARACLMAGEAEYVEPGAYNITGSDVVLPCATRDILAHHCPGLDLSTVPEGTASPMSCAKARAAFGYAPAHPVAE